MSTIEDREHWIKCALEEPPCAIDFDPEDHVQPDDFVQCGVGQMQECLVEIKERDSLIHDDLIPALEALIEACCFGDEYDYLAARKRAESAIAKAKGESK